MPVVPFEGQEGEHAPWQETALSARVDRFDSLPVGYAPKDFDAGFRRWGQFLGANFLPLMPDDKATKILCISCGFGYFVKRLTDEGYFNVIGIDSNPEWIACAERNNLNCITAEALPYLAANPDTFDVIWCGNEIMHLTKDELFRFLVFAYRSLRPDGQIILISHNGANPLTAPDGFADNIDHHAIYTPHSMRQVLMLSGFRDCKIVPLKLYVFYWNPLNYLGMIAEFGIHLLLRGIFLLYNKQGAIFTKKIVGVGRKSV